MNTFLIIWGVVICICFIEGIFCTKLDSESEEYLNNRNKKK